MSVSSNADNIPSPEFGSLRRCKLKELKDTPALIKMLALLAKNKDMKIHSAAQLASSYTTGASTPAIARRLVKRYKTATSEFFNVVLQNDQEWILKSGFDLSLKDHVKVMSILEMIETKIIDGNWRHIVLSNFWFERIHRLNPDGLNLMSLRTLELVIMMKILYTKRPELFAGFRSESR